MIRNDLPHSYVWPADYNWLKPPHNHAGTEVSADVSTVKQVNFPVSSTEILVPWLLSMWMMGNKTSTDYPSKPKSIAIRKFYNLRENIGLKDRFTWNQIDIEYPDRESKRNALKTGKFIPINNLPLGLEIWKNKMFISLPQWKPGIPVTLAYVNLNSYDKSPVLKPYPSWNWFINHKQNRCDGLVSVFRMEVDKCDRLWVLDSGAINLAKRVDQICPVKLDVFDLNTNRLVKRFVIPKNQTSKDSLFTNIVVEILNDDCEDTYAYMSDVFQYGLIVYNYKEDTSRRINHPYFYPDPLYCQYSIDGIKFNWMDGIFGMCLSPEQHNRVLYFHSMSSQNEFYVPTVSLRNTTIQPVDLIEHFVALKDSRCTRHQSCQSSGMAMDTRGIMYYNLVTKGQVGCWNSNREFGPVTQGILPSSSASMSFPNDLKVDKEPVQRIWMLSNGLHKYLYGKLNPTEINYRIMMAYTDDVTKGTVCE
ncbi:Six-bladed beta-propeller, TolB-like,Major royal jelly protein/protein yellow [Cinara cedri]|uniref:Six-bladed beta-propeller, TolB-like,Major royal jelly protein/protein yellow n=1 Tax=Cinara cedri TaxID=506608 RepID=A0A5E4MTM3_9HEMI|nr:Six-bladed beta-propeller, TolB-like,Major royal jelly protein/protein yellow [Cinara cedri]